MSDEDMEGDFIPIEEIDWNALREALWSLSMFDDLYMRMQATNLGIVDTFLTGIEYEVLQESFSDRPDRSGLYFLNAQSQMWMFSAYELLRTWRERVRDAMKWHANGVLQQQIDKLRIGNGFRHMGRETRARQLEWALRDPESTNRLSEDLRLTHILFGQLEYLRMALAKHEVKGRGKNPALAPGVGRPDPSNGSLQYELEAGRMSFGLLSRRDVANGIRSWLDRGNIPTDADIKEFDEFMKADFSSMPDPFAGLPTG